MWTTETGLAARVVAHYEGMGLDLYQEVEFDNGRIDIVTVRSDRRFLSTIEVKRSFGLDVIAQAIRWLYWANESWIAVPLPRCPRLGHQFGLSICSDRGVGVLYVDEQISVEVPARLSYPVTHDLFDALHPDQKTAAPAGSVCGHSTPWKRTAKALASFVEVHPGVTLGDAVDSVDHHFGGRQLAISSLSCHLNVSGPERRVELSSVRIDGRGSSARLYPMGGEF